MNAPLELALISARPVLANALCDWLESGPDPFRCDLLRDADLFGRAPTVDPAVVLIAPEVPSEMARWLPSLRERFVARPWLLLADLRLAGIFLEELERQFCTLVEPGASAEALREALRALTQGRALFPPTALRELASRPAPRGPDGERVTLFHKEIQCGCALSLGLTNPQIAELLALSPGTLKSYLYRLTRKLQLPHREALARYFERAFSAAQRPGSD